MAFGYFVRQTMMQNRWLVFLLCLTLVGCNPSKAPEEASNKPNADLIDASIPPTFANGESIPDPPITDGPVPELESAGPNDYLLAARLTPEQLEQGWIRLFDGHEMTGWFYVGTANWTFGKGAITVDGGDSSLLCTSFQVSDFELLVDFKAAETTESGIFLRSSADPRDSSRDCYQLSIAPKSYEFPTGSLVKRQKVNANATLNLSADQWHTYRIIVQGNQVKAWLDGEAVVDYTDSRKLPRGYIGLQHQLGRVSFRNILMRPLSGNDLALNEGWQADWKQLDNAAAHFVSNRRKLACACMVALASWNPKVSGMTLYCKPLIEWLVRRSTAASSFAAWRDRYNEAYECQIYDGPVLMEQNKPTRLQTGALSIPIKGDLTNARVQASVGLPTTYLTIIADEGQFTTFVNGLLVTDAADTREASANPKAGFRREAGKLGLQAFNEDCDILFQRLSISPISKR